MKALDVCRGHRFRWSLLLTLLFIVGIPTAHGQSGVGDELAQALNLFAELEFDKGIELASGLLERPDLTSQDRVAVYSVLSMINFSKGKKYENQAYDYLNKIMDIGPCVTAMPSDYWVKPLREHWYTLCQKSDNLTCSLDDEKDIKTIAIMEFDNFSSGEYQEKLGYVTKGLSDFFEADFAQLNDLKVVERDKIDFILKEIMMTQEGLVDQATAVRAGKLLGAQIMVFGSVMQMDKKNARMMVKAIKVETSEILATAERSGKPEFFAMVPELVMELASKLDMELNPDTEKKIDSARTGDDDAAGLYSQGLFYVDKYEYAKAYDFFKQAYEKDSSFSEAKKKMEIYRPLAMSS